MKCPKCGAENPNDSMFCIECGMELKKETSNSKNTLQIICGIAIVATVVMTIVAIVYSAKYINLECHYLDKQYNSPFNIEEHRDNLLERIHDFGTSCPIMITFIDICSTDYNGNVISGWGDMIYANKAQYLNPVIVCVSAENQEITLYIRIYANGSLLSIPSGMSNTTFSTIKVTKGQNYIGLDGWGSTTAGFWESGDYRYEFWYNDKCIGIRQFTMY